jgi:hypothetical protein
MGKGDGSTTTFNIPGKATADHSFARALAGSTAALTISSISVGTGPDGCDQVTFTSAPTADWFIYGSFRGRRYFTVYYDRDDQPTPRQVEPGTWDFLTRLVQVK